MLDGERSGDLVLGNLAGRRCPDDVGLGGVQDGISPDDLGDDDGDVVGTATGMGVCRQKVDDVVQIGGVEMLGDRLVVDEAAQSVRAEENAVAQPKIHDLGVRDVLGLTVEHLEKERPMRMNGGLLGGDPTIIDEGLHPRVVVGHPLHAALTQQVAAGVTDVDHAELGA